MTALPKTPSQKATPENAVATSVHAFERLQDALMFVAFDPKMVEHLNTSQRIAFVMNALTFNRPQMCAKLSEQQINTLANDTKLVNKWDLSLLFAHINTISFQDVALSLYKKVGDDLLINRLTPERVKNAWSDYMNTDSAKGNAGRVLTFFNKLTAILSGSDFDGKTTNISYLIPTSLTDDDKETNERFLVSLAEAKLEYQSAKDLNDKDLLVLKDARSKLRAVLTAFEAFKTSKFAYSEPIVNKLKLTVDDIDQLTSDQVQALLLGCIDQGTFFGALKDRPKEFANLERLYACTSLQDVTELITAFETEKANAGTSQRTKVETDFPTSFETKFPEGSYVRYNDETYQMYYTSSRGRKTGLELYDTMFGSITLTPVQALAIQLATDEQISEYQNA